MIVTTIDKLTDYKDLSWAKAVVDFIEDFKKTDMKTGRYDIDGDNMFASVNRYDTEPAENRQFENHRKYIDVQVLMEGEEILYWAPVETLSMTKDGVSDGGDCSFYTGEAVSSVVLGKNTCAVLFENDAHMPNVMNKKCESVLKIVFKILA